MPLKHFPHFVTSQLQTSVEFTDMSYDRPTQSGAEVQGKGKLIDYLFIHSFVYLFFVIALNYFLKPFMFICLFCLVYYGTSRRIPTCRVHTGYSVGHFFKKITHLNRHRSVTVHLFLKYLLLTIDFQ